ENGTRKGWFWGGSGDPNIYHDVETRRNAFSYRLYMSRLIEKLIEENKYDKAKKVIDLALEKMPVDFFIQYEMVVSFVEAYYLVGEKQKTRELREKIIKKYQE